MQNRELTQTEVSEFKQLFLEFILESIKKMPPFFLSRGAEAIAGNIHRAHQLADPRLGFVSLEMVQHAVNINLPKVLRAPSLSLSTYLPNQRT